MIRGIPRGRFTGPVPRPFEASYGDEYESYTETDDMMASSGNGEVCHGYVRTRLAPPDPHPSEYYGLERSSSERSGPYESYDSGSSKGSRDLHRSGFGSSYDDGYDRSPSSNQFYSEESRWDSSYPSAAIRSGFLGNEGRGGYSSYSGGGGSPHAKLAPYGSRGRGMPAYPQNSFGGRSNDVGGPPAFRGRGRGFIASGSGIRPPMATGPPRPQAFRPMERVKPPMVRYGPPRPEFYGGYQLPPLPAARGMKRKMMAPPPPAIMVKKQKPFPVINKTAVINTPAEGLPQADDDDEADDSAESKQRKARRVKQKRKRVKEIEKYGDMYRLAFTCAFCKVRTCDDKEIEDHFASTFHQQTLAHIQKQTKFDEKTMAFLHESMVNKFRKNVLRKRNNAGAEPTLEEIQRELSKAVVEEVCLSKVEMILCLACHTHVPAALVSLQIHLQSSEHLKNKSEFTETQKRESVLAATSIMTNPIVKARFDKYLKGENPFDDEIKQDAEESQPEEAEGDLNHIAE
ncbi:DBIRD complex subunit ZNF326 isoform X1 [Conger conger]|uniref:DBIRD complex subunit ZNF326 isoform X1 n=1 Tax=Conger conger TaxID=82655 RepID=UPI002A59F96F|nr:DBIRD complex subunit ZNF326 isoform X1 [Conger conger]